MSKKNFTNRRRTLRRGRRLPEIRRYILKRLYLESNRWVLIAGFLNRPHFARRLMKLFFLRKRGRRKLPTLTRLVILRMKRLRGLMGKERAAVYFFICLERESQEEPNRIIRLNPSDRFDKVFGPLRTSQPTVFC